MELIKLIDKLSTKLSVVITFADQNYPQTDPSYYKILLDNDKKIISEKILIYTPNLDTLLKQVFDKYMKVSYEWPLKYLADCRKTNSELEIVYGIKMAYINDCIKDGELVNINEYKNLGIESYYDGIISSTATRAI